MNFILSFLFVLFSFSAYAQTGSSKTQAQLNTEINTLWPDNSSGLITPFNSRQTLLDLVASSGNNSPTVLNALNFAGATAGDKISACVAAVPATGGVCDARGLPSGGTISTITLANNLATLIGPCGLFTVTGTINIGNAVNTLSGFHWVGCNGNLSAVGGTELVWGGNNSSPMLRVRGVRDSEFRDFNIHASSVTPLATAIQSETATGTATTHNIYKNLYLDGQDTGLGIGIRWCTGNNCGGAGADANNDGNLIDGVQVVNYNNAAFSIEHGQSKTHTFSNSSFNGGAAGQNGVVTTQGSFRWFGGLGGNNQVADFNLGAPTDNILISSANTENSNRFITTASSNNQWAVTVVGGRWSATNLNVDNRAIVYQMQGPLTVIGVTFEGGLTGKNPQLWMNPAASARASAVAIGNGFTWEVGGVSVTSDPFTSAAGNYWTTMGNQIQSGNASVHFPITEKYALNNLLVASLPTCNASTSGLRQVVSDQNTAISYRGAVTGSGVAGGTQAVFCNGTNWLQD